MKLNLAGKPDFQELEAVITGRKQPTRVHLVELGADEEVMRFVAENVLDRPPWIEIVVVHIVNQKFHGSHVFRFTRSVHRVNPDNRIPSLRTGERGLVSIVGGESKIDQVSGHVRIDRFAGNVDIASRHSRTELNRLAAHLEFILVVEINILTRPRNNEHIDQTTIRSIRDVNRFLWNQQQRPSFIP